MIDMNIQPWPSTYAEPKDIKAKIILPNIPGREVGAFRVGIPPRTIEPPQVHLIAKRDGAPFQELLTDLSAPMVVTYFSPKTMRYISKEYAPGQNILIPEYKIHWLINSNSEELRFTCEYAPAPWDGDNDEPEFKDLKTLLEFAEENGFIKDLT